MPQAPRWSLGALALALAAACLPPGGTATTTDAASDTASSTGSESASSTGVATGEPDTTTTNPTSTTGVESTSTTGDTTGDTTGARGCGDGVAEPGKLCFDLIPVEDPSYISHVALGDMNEDGHLDLVATVLIPCPLVDDGPVLAAAPSPAPLPGAPREGGSIFYLVTALGDGAGGLAPLPPLQPPYGVEAGALIGDFTGDGHLDVAFGGETWDEINQVAVDNLVVLPGDGAGGHGPAIATTLAVLASRLAAGDVDGDGDLDLVSASYHGLGVLLGDGAGGFTPAVVDAATYDAPALHDLDGDADLDLLVLRAPVDAAVVTLLGAGDGTFTAGQIIPFEGSPTDLAVLSPAQGEHPVALVTSYTSMIGRRLHALEIAGDGVLAAPELIPDVTGEYLAVGAFDSAPRPDVISVGHDTAAAVLGEEPWPPPAEPLLAEPLAPQSHLAVGDLNEDGIDDVVIPQGGAHVLLSDP